MPVTIDVDIGGTFTDCYLTLDGRTVSRKTETTTYDLSVGFLRVIEESAREIRLSLEEFLRRTERIRYSTTVAMNKLLEHRGPRLGLLTTEGFEDFIIIGRGSQWADGLTIEEQRQVARAEKPTPLIPRELTVGIRERIDSKGQVVRSLNEEDVREKIHALVDQGVRGFVVCLLWSFLNPIHELRIQEIFREEYPDCTLGSIPMLLSHQVLPKHLEYQRAMTTILNAYLHQAIAEEIGTISDELRQRGYRRPLFLVHNTGGMAESFRTSAIETFNGGPVAGLMGSAHWGKIYGFPNIITADMGGTSFDFSLVVQGSTRLYDYQPVIDKWMVGSTMLWTRSIGAGGGSIAWINTLLGNRLEVGPRSAGAMPGPAAYNQGGSEPTVTDADVILGYLNPDRFHGGKKRLSLQRARRAVEEKIARPLGISVEEAALLIKKIVDAKMGQIIYTETALRGYNPKEFVLFAFGGAGPTHCCGFGSFAGLERIVVFPHSPVFCAYGSSTLDTLHIYESSRRLLLIDPKSQRYLEDYESFNQAVQALQEKARRDLTGEGFAEDEILYSLEIDMRYGGQLDIKRTAAPSLFLHSEEDVKALCRAFEIEYSEAYSPLSVFPESGVDVENFILKAFVPNPRPAPTRYDPVSTDPSVARVGERKALWEGMRELTSTPVYAEERLSCGHRLVGPAIIESDHTTLILAPGWRYCKDEFGNGVIEKVES